MYMKTCKQCGELKPIDQYRQYYGGRQGSYKTCRQCERINSREKYLTAKGELRSYEEHIELDNIHKLYDVQRKLGLQPPNKRTNVSNLQSTVEEMLEKYNDTAIRISREVVPTVAAETPKELLRWLTKDLVSDPEYYLDEVYEHLVAKYRPAIGIDGDTMMPMYDDTNKEILDKILARFNEYEDNYYKGVE